MNSQKKNERNRKKNALQRKWSGIHSVSIEMLSRSSLRNRLVFPKWTMISCEHLSTLHKRRIAATHLCKISSEWINDTIRSVRLLRVRVCWGAYTYRIGFYSTKNDTSMHLFAKCVYEFAAPQFRMWTKFTSVKLERHHSVCVCVVFSPEF